MLTSWCYVAAAVLVGSFAVHLSTFFGFDPMEKLPGVMFLHLAIFPPFIAAMVYTGRGGGSRTRQDRVFQAAPLGLRIATGVFFIYAFVNFALFVIQSEGGGPERRDGKYFITSHGRVIREMTEAEFHRHQAYVVRGFSGHWMVFACASLTFLVGARTLRREAAEVPAPPESPPAEPAAVRPAEPIAVRTGLIALGAYLACVALILSGRPVLGVIAVPPVAVAAVLALRRRHGFPHQGFESGVGCLTVFPNAFLGSLMGRAVSRFIYLAVRVGLESALTGHVQFLFPKEGPSQLSTGEPLDNPLWAGLMILVHFPLFAVGALGLTHLADQAGRLVQRRRGDVSADGQ